MTTGPAYSNEEVIKLWNALPTHVIESNSVDDCHKQLLSMLYLLQAIRNQTILRLVLSPFCWGRNFLLYI